MRECLSLGGCVILVGSRDVLPWVKCRLTLCAVVLRRGADRLCDLWMFVFGGIEVVLECAV